MGSRGSGDSWLREGEEGERGGERGERRGEGVEEERGYNETYDYSGLR
jgi:hypothetical protein